MIGLRVFGVVIVAASCVVLSRGAHADELRAPLDANGGLFDPLNEITVVADQFEFSCGESQRLRYACPGFETAVGQKRISGRGAECRKLIQNKEDICRQLLPVPTDSDDEAATASALWRCGEWGKRRAGELQISCRTESAAMCAEPTSCEPYTKLIGATTRPIALGRFRRFASVYPYETGGYRHDQSCELVCGWRTFMPAVEGELEIGCGQCESGAGTGAED